jgi:NADH dehydrogenase
MILVVGATGSLGGSIVRRLLEQGHQVRALVRTAPDAKVLTDLGAEPAMGDLKDRASLDAACQGIETVITTANSARRGGEDNPETVEDKGNRQLIDAAEAAGVDQFVFVSALGASPSSPVPFLAGKGKAEERLRASRMRHTILEPNLYMDVRLSMLFGMPLAQGLPITLVGGGLRKHTFIAQDDVRAFALATIGNPAASNQTLVVAGPQALSFRDVVAAYERVLGRSLEVRHLKAGAPLPGAPEFINQMLAALDTYDSPIPVDETARTFGIQLTSVDEFARRSVSASLRG